MSSSRLTTFCASVSFLPGWLTTCLALTAFKSNLCFSCERNDTIDLHTIRLLGYQTLVEYLMQNSFWKQMSLNIEKITCIHVVITCYQPLEEIPCEYNGVSANFFLFKCCSTAVALSTLSGNWLLRGSGTIDLYFFFGNWKWEASLMLPKVRTETARKSFYFN